MMHNHKQSVGRVTGCPESFGFAGGSHYAKVVSITRDEVHCDAAYKSIEKPQEVKGYSLIYDLLTDMIVVPAKFEPDIFLFASVSKVYILIKHRIYAYCYSGGSDFIE